MRRNLQRYARKIKSNKRSIINRKSLAYQIPRKSILITFDVETTGLTANRNDEIHEIAAMATSFEAFKNLSFLHTKSRVRDDNQPIFIIKKKVIAKLDKVFKKLDDINYFIYKAVRRFVLVKGLKVNGKVVTGIEESYDEAIYNIIKEFTELHEIEPGSPLLEHLYYALKNLSVAYDIHWVLKLTNYKHKDPVRVTGESVLALSFLDYINSQTQANAGKKELILVGQNIMFDVQMLTQALMTSNISEKIYSQILKLKFIDTAQIMRKYTNKYMLCYFIYFYRKWVASSRNNISGRDERLKKVLLKLEPVKNNQLGFLTDYFEIENNAWHTADNDIKATEKLLFIQLCIDLKFQEKCRVNKTLRSICEEVESYKKSPDNKISDRRKIQLSKELKETGAGENVVEIVEKFIDEFNDSFYNDRHKIPFSDVNYVITSNDHYRKKHIELFNKFIKSIGMCKEDFKVNEEKDNKNTYNKSYEDLTKRKFPGITGKFKIDENWYEQTLF